eukprot:4516124-Prymnesium_polylepis.1
MGKPPFTAAAVNVYAVAVYAVAVNVNPHAPTRPPTHTHRQMADSTCFKQSVCKCGASVCKCMHAGQDICLTRCTSLSTPLAVRVSVPSSGLAVQGRRSAPHRCRAAQMSPSYLQQLSRRR